MFKTSFSQIINVNYDDYSQIFSQDEFISYLTGHHTKYSEIFKENYEEDDEGKTIVYRVLPNIPLTPELKKYGVNSPYMLQYLYVIEFNNAENNHFINLVFNKAKYIRAEATFTITKIAERQIKREMTFILDSLIDSRSIDNYLAEQFKSIFDIETELINNYAEQYIYKNDVGLKTANHDNIPLEDETASNKIDIKDNAVKPGKQEIKTVIEKIQSFMKLDKEVSQDHKLLIDACALSAMADGKVSTEEQETILSYVLQIREFRGLKEEEVESLLEESLSRIKSDGTQKALNSLTNISNQDLKNKAYFMATDVAFSSFGLDENEMALLSVMRELLEISREDSIAILNALNIKHK